MKSKHAKWSLIQLLTIIMVVAAGNAFAAGEALLHNSNNLGTTYGTWGVAFTCTTCHSTATNNVKRVIDAIPNTIGPNANKPIIFNNMTAFGDDSAAHATSFRICEACHTKTKYHQYNTANAPQSGNLNHPNGDCRQCHSHADAFKAAGCTNCHGHNAASDAPIVTGKHAAHTNNVGVLGVNYSCAACHAPTVSSDTVFSNAANHNPNNYEVATPGGPDVNYGGTNAGAYASGSCTSYCHTNGNGGAAAVAVTWNGATTLDCKGCHGGSSQAGEPAGTHTKHVGTTGAAATCQNCHRKTVSGSFLNASGNHTNQVKDVAAGNGKSFTFTAGTCSNASCHTNGFFTAKDATWGTTLNCTGCHDTTTLASGKHNKHLNATNFTSATCGSCHADTAQNNTTLVPANSTHMNAGKDVNFAVDGTFTTGTCAVYCHSYGTVNVAPFKVKTVATWNGATVYCYSCHGSDSTSGLLNNMSTGRHKKHMVGQYTYGCAVCHAATVSNNTTISGPAKHVDSKVNVTFSGIAGGSATFSNNDHTPGATGTVNDSCQNVYCHSNAQVQVGHVNSQFRNLTGNKRFSLSTSASLNCSGCHGSSTTTGQFQLSGKHQAHLTAPVTFNCNQCHLNGGTNNNRASHANGMVNYSSQWTGRAVLASGSCNNVYCHSNGKGTFVNMTSANWFSARTLDCKGCHGGDSSQAGEPVYATGAAGSATANNHPKHVGTAGADAACQSCHSKTVSGIFLNGSTHNVMLGTSSRAIPYHADQNMNDTSAGVYPGNNRTFTYTAASKTCSNISCHSGNGLVSGVAAAQWGASLGCEGCHGGSGSNKIVTGQHAQHTNNAAVIGVNFGCVECHAQTVSNDTTLASGTTTHMNAMVNFSGAKAGKTKAACTAAYCHSDGKGGSGVTAVSWTTGPVLDCKGCHGGASSQAGEPVYTTTAPGTLMTNSHPKHVGTTAADTTCQNCHGSTMNAAALGNSGNHLNGAINVINGNGKTFTYSNDSTKTCSNITCHSGNGIITGVADIQWGATMPADCTGCHGNEVNAATMLSGAHNTHLNNASAGGSFKCKDCHASTITSADNRTIATLANHGNNLVNYSGVRAGKNKTCATIYCHSNGKGVFAAIPAWVGGTADCQSCHATGSLQVDHSKHIAKGAACAQCHAATTSNSITITGSTHIDGTVNLQQGGANFNGKTVSFAPVGTTCNNISCHSAYASPVNSATWGMSATCETCHPKAGLSGAHQVHMGALDLNDASLFYNMTANKTPVIAQVSETDRKHGFGCANCHPMTTGSHLNGAIDVDLNRVNVTGVGTLRFLNHSSASYDMASTKKCSNLYCHSNASRIEIESNVKSNTSLAWTDTYAAHPELDRCAQCHLNQPTTGAHAAHSVGLHTFNDGAGSMIAGNIYQGRSGKVPITNRANTAHGNPNNSTTIGCSICHFNTVSSSANDRNTRCVVCHYTGNPNGATLKGYAVIANLRNHVNGSREVQFKPIQVLSKAQIRPKGASTIAKSGFDFYSGVWQRTSYKSYSTLSFDKAKLALDTATMWHPGAPMASNCTNIACHNGRSVNWNLANFNDANKCMDCHNAL